MFCNWGIKAISQDNILFSSFFFAIVTYFHLRGMTKSDFQSPFVRWEKSRFFPHEKWGIKMRRIYLFKKIHVFILTIFVFQRIHFVPHPGWSSSNPCRRQKITFCFLNSFVLSSERFPVVALQQCCWPSVSAAHFLAYYTGSNFYPRIKFLFFK